MVSLKIHNNIPVQNDFWGNGAIYHGFAGQPDDMDRVYTEEQCDLEAARAANMRLKIARTFYGWWAFDEARGVWDWDNERMTAFYGWLSRMKAANITVALNTGWCSPGDINSTCWNGKSPFTVENDWEQSVKNYADWVSETVYQLVELRGFTNVKILTLFTEPQRYSGKPNDPSQTPYDLWFESSKAVHEALLRDGRRDKVFLMGPNEGSTVSSDMLKEMAQKADFIDIFSSHNYQWVETAKAEYIKTGNTYMALTRQFSRASQKVKLKPKTDYVATIDMLYKSDFPDQQGSFIFGVYKYHESGDIVAGGLLPSATYDSILVINPNDIPKTYKRYTIRFNSGDVTEALFGVFSGVKWPDVLNTNTLGVTDKSDTRKPGVAFIEKMSLVEIASGTQIAENHDFSKNYEGWNITSTAGGVPEPYTDWYSWSKTALAALPGEKNNKAYCYDEYNITYNRDNSRDELGAELVDAAVALMNSGVRATMLWTLFDQQWPNNHTYNNDSFVDGDHRCGLMPNLRFSTVPHKAFYAFSLLSRYVDGFGTKVYEGEGKDGVHATMSFSADGEITIVVVNNSPKERDFTLMLDSPLFVTMFRHRFDPKTLIPDAKAKPIPADHKYKSIGDCICDHIAPYGVTVYTTHKD